VSHVLRKEHITIELIIRTVEIASLWGCARLPGDFLSTIRRRGVLLALARHVAKLLGGDNWAKAEISTCNSCNEDDGMAVLKNAISKRREEMGVGAVLARDCEDLALVTCYERVRRLASLTSKFHLLQLALPVDKFDVGWLSELALRLASDPVGVEAWAGERLRAGLALLMDAPTMARAARFLVLAIDHRLRSRFTSGELYAGWRWT